MKVAFNYHVYLKANMHYFSVPYRYRGQRVDVFYSEKPQEYTTKTSVLPFTCGIV